MTMTDDYDDDDDKNIPILSRMLECFYHRHFWRVLLRNQSKEVPLPNFLNSKEVRTSLDSLGLWDFLRLPYKVLR